MALLKIKLDMKSGPNNSLMTLSNFFILLTSGVLLLLSTISDIAVVVIDSNLLLFGFGLQQWTRECMDSPKQAEMQEMSSSLDSKRQDTNPLVEHLDYPNMTPTQSTSH